MPVTIHGATSNSNLHTLSNFKSKQNNAFALLWKVTGAAFPPQGHSGNLAWDQLSAWWLSYTFPSAFFSHVKCISFSDSHPHAYFPLPSHQTVLGVISHQQLLCSSISLWLLGNGMTSMNQLFTVITSRLKSHKIFWLATSTNNPPIDPLFITRKVSPARTRDCIIKLCFSGPVGVLLNYKTHLCLSRNHSTHCETFLS